MPAQAGGDPEAGNRSRGSLHFILDRKKNLKEVSNCDSCINFVYDDEDECYVCDMNLDEDDMVRFLTGTFDNCPYYQLDNEYLIVRHQM